MKKIGNFIAVVIVCGGSTLSALAVALLSINQTVINVTLVYCATCLAISLTLVSYNRIAAALCFAILPAISLSAAPSILTLFQNAKLQPKPTEFSLVCTSARAKYLSLPSSPVTSIAYDWSSDEKPEFGPYLVSGDGHISQVGGLIHRLQEFDNSIAVTEIRRFNNDGVKIFSPKYRRVKSSSLITMDEKGEDIDTLTADILVYFKITFESELKKSPANQGMIIYDVSITDRRNNQLISTMRYVVDQKHLQICGPTSNNTLYFYDFVAQSLGYLQPERNPQ